MIEKKTYQLESIVEVWSDYLRPHLHPQSLLTVPDYHHNRYELKNNNNNIIIV